MRLMLVISSLGSGGAERVLVTMANYWAQKGWHIHLATFDDGSEPPFYSLHPRVIHQPLGISRLSPNLARSLVNNLHRLRILRATVQSVSPQAVIAFMDRCNVLTLLATIGLKLPIIVSERTDPHFHSIGATWSALRRFLYPRAASIVAQTDHALQYFCPAMRGSGRIIPNPVRPPDPQAEGKPPHHTHSKTIMAMGRLGFEKGFDYLLRAFAKVASRHEQWRLEIWGEGPERTSLAFLIEELGLASRVRLPGRTREPATEMRRADLFVLSSRYEGFPNVLCEAMACGLPVISSDCPSGPREILRDGVDGVLVAPGNVEALASALDRLMANEQERKRLSEMAPQVLQRYRLEAVMELWEGVIREVVM